MLKINFQVGDIIETPGHLHPRLYTVDGVYLGAVRQEDGIELSPIDRTDASDPKKRSLLVPQEMLESGIESGLFKITEVNS